MTGNLEPSWRWPTSDEDDNPLHFCAPDEESGEEGRSRHGGQFNDRFNDINMKVDIPEFEGRIGPDEFIDWLNTVERVFDYKEVPHHWKVKIVAIKLTKYASAWWEQLTEWYLKMYNFRQGSMLVDEYTEEFDLLMVCCGIDEPEEQTIACYLGGLRREIHDAVVLQPYWSYDDIYKLAIKVEKQLKQQNTRAPTGVNNCNPSPREKMFDSGGKGSFNPKVSVKESKSIVEAGSRQLFLGDLKEDETPPVYDEYKENDKDITWNDHGEALVVQRRMTTAHVEDDDWLRHNIFRTKCTTNGKICNLIIDSGSCENVVSQDMVNKLKLKTKKCHIPYKLAWLQKGNEMHVDK
ncbi:hypothetical protein FF1_019350 [Malus domestica]